MSVDIRHKYRPGLLATARCQRCGRGRTNPIHRLTARCSVCWKIVKPYQLDGAKRCDSCAT